MPVSAGYRLPPPNFQLNDFEWKRKSAVWMLQAHQGHLGNVGLATLLSGTVTTVLTDARIGQASFIGLMPTTSNAAVELSTLFIASQSKGAATITHANAATGDRTFRYCILG